MCESPVLIYNSSLGKRLVVPCGNCVSCRISKVNSQVVDYYKYINKFDYPLFVTLTYDNRYLPFVVPNDFHVYRGLSFPYDIVEELPLDYSFIPGSYQAPENHSEKYAIGILYWKDIQLFHKRLRKYLNKNYGITGIRILTTGEYGSIGQRPHFHELYLSTCDITGQLQTAIIQCWQMCDWCKLELSECFKTGNSAVASYLASYVNSISDDYGILSSKWFKARSIRSKDVTFTIDDKVSTKFANYFRFFGVNNSVYINGERTFEEVRQQKDAKFSVGLIRAKILYSYFHPPKEASRLSYNAFRKRCFEVYSRYCFGCKDLVNSTDYLFMLGYRRYCDLFGYKYFSHNVFELYLLFSYRLWSFYQSEILRYEMEQFENMSREDYCRLKNNTSLDDSVKRQELFLKFTYNKNFVQNEHYSDLPQNSKNEVISQKQKYGYKLLPKHFNQLIENLL